LPEQRVTPLELFFDLVFVFAITQVTGFIAHDPTWTRLLEGLAILTAVWLAWDAYAWLGNSAGTDEGFFRLALFAALAGMLVVAITVPDAFGANALAFGIAYAAVRTLHIAAYAVIARGTPPLGHVVRVLAAWMLPSALLILLAGVVEPGAARTVCWTLALASEVLGLWFFGDVEHWQVQAGHMAERFGLIIIIALGESVAALGAGAQDHALDAGLIVAIVLGVAVACALWWAYFDVVAVVATRIFEQAEGPVRARMARDSYSYLHLPMVAGIILFALGVKKTLAHYGDPLEAVPAVGLCGGVALYLLAHVAYRMHNTHTLNRQRLLAGVVLCALIPVATAIPALAALGLVAALTVALVTFEAIHFHESRARLRHAGTSMS
jgi:low temperature requirement protein LtrA